MTAPQQTPGGQREDTAIAVGAAIAAVMATAQLALLALLPVAVMRVLRGGSRRLVARQVHAAATAIVQRADQQAQTVLRQAERRIIVETTANLPRVPHPPTQTAPVRVPPSRPAVEDSIRNVELNALRQAEQRITQETTRNPPHVPTPHQPEPALPESRPKSHPAEPLHREPAETTRDPTHESLHLEPALPPWKSVEQSIRDAGLNALRETDDAFRDAAEKATANHVTGTRAAQDMLDRLAEHGLTVFTDARGREWDLASYCEMATRTAATRLALSTQLGLMGPPGMDLVLVDAPSGEAGCRRCAPFEGRVLSLSGRVMTGVLVAATDVNGVRKSANLAGSLAEAVAAGLLHPNCRHFLMPFTDGAHLPLVGSPRGFVRHGAPIYRVVIPQKDSASYRAQQKQRALERVVRQQVAAKAVALTPVAKAHANRRLVAARSNLEQHVRDYHLTRQRYRENPAKAR